MIGKSVTVSLMTILRSDGTPVWGDPVILCCLEKHRREVLAARTPNRHR